MASTVWLISPALPSAMTDCRDTPMIIQGGHAGGVRRKASAVRLRSDIVMQWKEECAKATGARTTLDPKAPASVHSLVDRLTNHRGQLLARRLKRSEMGSACTSPRRCDMAEASHGA